MRFREPRWLRGWCRLLRAGLSGTAGTPSPGHLPAVLLPATLSLLAASRHGSGCGTVRRCGRQRTGAAASAHGVRWIERRGTECYITRHDGRRTRDADCTHSRRSPSHVSSVARAYRMQRCAMRCGAVRRAGRGAVDADLGGGVIKQRIARQGRGRSIGFRVIVVFRRWGARVLRLRVCEERPGESSAQGTRGVADAGGRDARVGRPRPGGDAGKQDNWRGELRWPSSMRARCWRRCTRPRSA